MPGKLRLNGLRQIIEQADYIIALILIFCGAINRLLSASTGIGVTPELAIFLNVDWIGKPAAALPTSPVPIVAGMITKVKDFCDNLMARGMGQQLALMKHS